MRFTLLYFSTAVTVESFILKSCKNLNRLYNSFTMKFDEEIGALQPLGFWDPLGFSRNVDSSKFINYREAELKHGRVAMLAFVGYAAQENFRLPGTIDLDGTSFNAIPNGVAAIGAVPSWIWNILIALIGYWELIGWEDRRPVKSDMGIGDFGFYITLPETPEKKKDYLTKEIQNGRLSMLAIMELLTHDIAKPAGESLFALHHF